jgi:hypothetical protein
VRPVTPGDVEGLEALYAARSDEDRYRRFFSQYRPTRSFFERLADVADRGGCGLVALDGDRIVGEASYELPPDGDGELGMTVAADRRGWLGPYLLDALAEAAAARGVPNLEADVFVTYGRVLSLLRSRGYATMSTQDWTTLRLSVGTAGRTPVWPAAGAGAGRAPGPGGDARRSMHADAPARDAGLTVVACSGPRGRRPRCPVLAGRACPLAAGADAIVVSSVPDDEVWRARRHWSGSGVSSASAPASSTSSAVTRSTLLRSMSRISTGTSTSSWSWRSRSGVAARARRWPATNRSAVAHDTRGAPVCGWPGWLPSTRRSSSDQSAWVRRLSTAHGGIGCPRLR